jgi:ribosomal protein L25 (general stress protein Ctc)
MESNNSRRSYWRLTWHFRAGRRIAFKNASIWSIIFGCNINVCIDRNDKISKKTTITDAKLNVLKIDKNEKKIICKDATRFV